MFISVKKFKLMDIVLLSLTFMSLYLHIFTLGLDWYLCSTDWTGEEDKPLDTPDANLKDIVRHGDLLLLKQGVLPPKVKCVFG